MERNVNAFWYALLSLVALFCVPVVAQPLIQESEQAISAVFPAALEWQRIEGAAKSIETRSGRLSIHSSTERCPGTREPILYTEIRMDDNLLERMGCTSNGDYYLVFFKNVFDLQAMTVVILGANAGGSASPPERLHLVVLDPHGQGRIEMDPTFRSIDGTQRVASDGTRLWFDLGYVDGKRKVGVFDGESFRIE